MNDSLPIINLNPHQIGIFAAAVARVANNEDYKFKVASDPAIAEFEEVLGADINVYDRNGQRNMVFFFQYGTIEVCVGAQPPKPNAPEEPDFDPEGGTPGMAPAARLAS